MVFSNCDTDQDQVNYVQHLKTQTDFKATYY